MPTIGITMTASDDFKIDFYAKVVKTALQKADVLFIPHSRAYVSWKNNDLVMSQRLWSRWEMWATPNKGEFNILPDVPNVVDILDYYKKLDLCVCDRYHSMIFSDIAGIPFVSLINGLKKESFKRDYTGTKGTFFDKEEELLSYINELNLTQKPHE